MLCHVELIKKKNKVNSVLTTHPFRNRTLPMFQTLPLCFCLIGAPFLPKGKHYFWENYSFTLPAMMEHYIGGPHNEPWLSLISPVQSPSMLTSGSVSIWVDLADGTVISMIVRTDAETEALILWALTHWKRPWCWERLKAGGEGDVRGWDGWMASPTWRTWVWVSSGSWWWTMKPGVLQSMGLQRVGHDWVTELN